MEKPAIPALSIKSLGNTRKLTTEESEQVRAGVHSLLVEY